MRSNVARADGPIKGLKGRQPASVPAALRRPLKSQGPEPGARRPVLARDMGANVMGRKIDEEMQLGIAAPGLVPEDDTILPDRGKPVPESLQCGDGNHGVLDPAEPGHPLPEGLERRRAGPLNKSTGRRVRINGGGGG